MISEKLDQLERLTRLLCERPLYPRGELRKQTARLGDYVTALSEYDAAKLRAEAKPDDSKANRNLNRAREFLEKVREELKRQLHS